MRVKEIFEVKSRREPITQFNYHQFQSDCKIAIKKYKEGMKIWRGASDIGDFAIGDSTKKYRRSRFATQNAYTVWIDNHPTWMDFPKRSRSFVCSTDKGIAGSYGDRVYNVFPVGNPIIGICPRYDIQVSTEYGYKKYGFGLMALNSMLTQFYAEIKNGRYKFKTPEEGFTTFEQLMDGLKLIQKNFIDNIDPEILNAYLYGDDEKQERAYKKITPEQRHFLNILHRLIAPKKNIIETIADALDPYKNGFKVINLSELQTNTRKGESIIQSLDFSKEIWFSGKAYFLSEEMTKELLG